MHVKSKHIALLLPLTALMACNGCKNQTENSTVPHNDTTHVAPVNNAALSLFNADSAYKYTKEQVDFGPRIPGTEAHEKCLQFIINTLKRDSLKVTLQTSVARTYDGKKFSFTNVIASSQPENPVRIFISGHWDTRPFADLDTIEPDKPFDGADDGGSSAAELLELARNLKKLPANIGVDLVFFDLEDYGQEYGDDDYPEMKDSWALGSQYWAHNLPQGYNPRYGILLDMVGGKNATFPMEGTSMKYAADIVKKIWDIAAQMGYGNYFTNEVTVETTDDHTYVNKIANIPTIDIVDYRIRRLADGNPSGDYPYFHHKHSDNMSVIDTASLHMVGRLLIKVIISENKTPS
jgi:hypothetical protein